VYANCKENLLQTRSWTNKCKPKNLVSSQLVKSKGALIDPNTTSQTSNPKKISPWKHEIEPFVIESERNQNASHPPSQIPYNIVNQIKCKLLSHSWKWPRYLDRRKICFKPLMKG
jgi:hypothetical protein